LDSWSPAAPGEPLTQSEEFRTRSAAHNVRLHQTRAKHVHHPIVGDLSLTFEMLELRADPGLTILTYTAEPGSKSEEALNLLASWTATLEQAEPANVADEA
jgi:MmyB-like transcription regulator ligand binding domain